MSRKASEVLLSLEQRVNQQEHYFKNMDMLLKKLVNQVSALEKALTQPITEEEKQYYAQTPGGLQHQQIPAGMKSPQPQPQQTPQRIPGLKPSVISAPDGTLNNVREEEEVNFEPYQPDEGLQVEKAPQGKRRDVRYTNDPVQQKRIPVQQKIVYEADNRNVCLASVEIFDSQNKLVGSSKTNNTGKWTQMLIPGKYAVSISKKGTATKQPVECSYFIEVPNSNETSVQDTVKV